MKKVEPHWTLVKPKRPGTMEWRLELCRWCDRMPGRLGEWGKTYGSVFNGAAPVLCVGQDGYQAALKQAWDKVKHNYRFEKNRLEIMDGGSFRLVTGADLDFTFRGDDIEDIIRVLRDNGPSMEDYNMMNLFVIKDDCLLFGFEDPNDAMRFKLAWG